MKRNTSAGGSFRGIITKEERPKHYKVTDFSVNLLRRYEEIII